ncbi:MAG TPA: putative glycoside hydrolase, partial [Candidatus Paceibacterota bacterium]
DAYFVNLRPDLAVKDLAGTSTWKDRKGISWIDAGSREYWDYIILLSEESRSIGFDEINFDYIRFPSDGNMKDISFPWSSTTPKSIVMKNFFMYLSHGLKDSGLKTSADLFGMTTTATGDMGIGQILEDALPYFDYISPMVYPSHYPPNFEGFADPESHPYEIINISMKRAVERAVLASTTKDKLRPWLQDFGLRVSYGPEEVRAQIKATNDVGLSSWLLWSASNKYTKSALESE